MQLYKPCCVSNSTRDIFVHPPYSPDLAPSDFFLFPKIKKHLAGKRFANDEDLKDAVVT